jgi:hypothetical protein
MNPKRCWGEWSYLNSKHSVAIYLERLKKTKNHSSENAWSLNQNSMLGRAERNAGNAVKYRARLSGDSCDVGVVRQVVN